MKMNKIKMAMVGVSAMALSILTFPAQANLVTNGEFSLFTNGGTNQIVSDSVGNNSIHAVLTGWTNNRPFTAVYGPNAAQTIGASGLNNNLYIWGPLNGAPSYNNFNDLSPNQENNPAANFLAMDSDPGFPGVGISQTIGTGLVQGQEYMLSYDWAAAQFTDVVGATDSGWTVTLGTQQLVDGTIGGTNAVYAHILSQGFSGWNHMSVNFTYQGGPTNVLSFLIKGSPSGLPPLALLDSVSLVAVPEPETYALMGIGLLGILAVRRQQNKRA